MDMGRVVRWSRKLSVNKVAWFLRSWYAVSYTHLRAHET